MSSRRIAWPTRRWPKPCNGLGCCSPGMVGGGRCGPAVTRCCWTTSVSRIVLHTWTHSSQMNTPGPAITLRTSAPALLQNEQHTCCAYSVADLAGSLPASSCQVLPDNERYVVREYLTRSAMLAAVSTSRAPSGPAPRVADRAHRSRLHPGAASTQLSVRDHRRGAQPQRRAYPVAAAVTLPPTPTTGNATHGHPAPGRYLRIRSAKNASRSPRWALRPRQDQRIGAGPVVCWEGAEVDQAAAGGPTAAQRAAG